MSPFCFPATPLQAPPSSAPPSPARTRHPHRFVGGRAGGKVSGQSPGVGGGAVCLHLHSAPGVPRAGSRVGSPEVRRFHHQVCGASVVFFVCFVLVLLPGSPKRQPSSFLGPDPVSSPSVFLPGGCGNWRLHTARGTLCPVIQFSGARRGAPRGRPAQAALIRPPTQPPGHPGSPRRRFAGARGAQAGSQTPLPGVVRRPPSCPAAAGPQAHSPGRREWADRSGQRATLAPRVRRDAAWAPRPSCPAVPPATERGRGGRAHRTPAPAGRRAWRRGAGRPF